MFNKRTSFILVIILILGLTLSGCANNNATNSDTSNKENNDEPKEIVELTLWTWKVAYVAGFQAVSDELEKTKGIKLNIETYTPDQTYIQKVTAAANAGALPDIIHWWATIPVQDGFQDISGIVDDELKNSLFDVAWNPVTVNENQVELWQSKEDASNLEKAFKVGQILGVPLDVGGFFTFYGNKNIMEEAGLEAKAPETWEEFVSMMETIKEKTGTPGLAMAAKFPNLWQNWMGFGLNAMYTGEDKLKALLTREETLSGSDHLVSLTALEELAKKDLILPGSLNLDIDQCDQAFAAGKAAFNLGGSFTFATLVNMGMTPDDFIAFPVPPLEGSKYDKWELTPFALTMLSLSDTCEDVDAAMEYIRYISSKEGAVLFANNAYSIPASKVADASKLNPSLKSIMDSYSSDGSDPLTMISDVYPLRYGDAEWRLFDNNTQRIIAGEITAEEAAKEFDEERERQVEAGN